MADFSGQQILVVGGSGALGAEFCKQLAAAGATVLATARGNDSAARIPSSANPRLLLDFAADESVAVLSSYLRETTEQLDGLIVASGVVAFGSIAELAPETVDELFQTNVVGPIKLMSALQPLLAASAAAGKSPFVVNLSGVVAERPTTGMAAYSASKAALYAFDQVAQRELRQAGIKVLDARPGHTETGLAGRAIAGQAPNFPTGMEPSHVVARILKALTDGERDLPSTEF